MCQASKWNWTTHRTAKRHKYVPKNRWWERREKFQKYHKITITIFVHVCNIFPWKKEFDSETIKEISSIGMWKIHGYTTKHNMMTGPKLNTISRIYTFGFDAYSRIINIEFWTIYHYSLYHLFSTTIHLSISLRPSVLVLSLDQILKKQFSDMIGTFDSLSIWTYIA